ncbi:unnamed protein product, partial [Callosobruchus maculatus]
SRFSVKTS